MQQRTALSFIRWTHTIIYLVMAASTLLLVYAGITGATGLWLWIALVLLAVETVVFVGNGFRCPLTALAVENGAEKGYAFDTFLPERATRYTFRVFGSLMVLGLFCWRSAGLASSVDGHHIPATQPAKLAPLTRP